MDKSLEYILEVARSGSIAQSAKKLYITPSALSKYIQNKEQELGVRLFDRTGKKFVLTYAGARYVEWSKEIVNLQERMQEELHNIAKEDAGRVHIGFPIIQSKPIISKVIPEYKKLYPNMEIVLEESSSIELEKQVAENRLDFAVVTTERIQPKIIYQKISGSQMVLAVPANHPIIATAVEKRGFRYPWIDITQTAGENYIVLYREQMLRRFADRLFETYHMAPNMPIQVFMIETTLQCVANNLGVTITVDTPVLNADQEVREKIAMLSFGEIPVERNLYVMHHKDHYIEKPVQALMDLCRKYL